MNKILFTLIGLLSLQNLQAQRIHSELIRRDIDFLASDALEGRGTSTVAEKKAAAYIATQFEAMQLLPKGNKGYYHLFQFRYNPNVHDTNTTLLKSRTGRNVIGFLDNQKEYTVVIGAHYDHLGLGMDHNSLDANPEGKIHNGADDNASGVAGMLELARYFANNGITENYNFLFMAFSGEELGLVGSKKWCENPTYPLQKINYMINLDMVGRYESDKKLLVYGVGTSSNWITHLEAVKGNMALKFDSSGIGPSDQTSFYLKGIPVLHFFTGQHSDYHKPGDDAMKINENGEAQIMELITDLVFRLDSKPKLDFLKTKETASTKMSFKVTLGIMPDYVFDGEGLRIDGVTEGKPAARAGIQQGDIIRRIGDEAVKHVQGYMKILNGLEKGKRYPVEVVRDGKTLVLEVTF